MDITLDNSNTTTVATTNDPNPRDEKENVALPTSLPTSKPDTPSKKRKRSLTDSNQVSPKKKIRQEKKKSEQPSGSILQYFKPVSGVPQQH